MLNSFVFFTEGGICESFHSSPPPTSHPLAKSRSFTWVLSARLQFDLGMKCLGSVCKSGWGGECVRISFNPQTSEVQSQLIGIETPVGKLVYQPWNRSTKRRFHTWEKTIYNIIQSDPKNGKNVLTGFRVTCRKDWLQVTNEKVQGIFAFLLGQLIKLSHDGHTKMDLKTY